MKKNRHIPLILTLCLAASTAFAAAPETPAATSPLWQTLEQAGATTRLADIGIASPRTLFIPRRFADANVGSLWLDGRKVIFPQGPQDVIGFLPTAGGYIVALFDAQGGSVVSESQGPESGASLIDPAMLKQMTPEQQVRILEAMAKIQGARPGAATVSTVARGAQTVFYRIDSAGKNPRRLGTVAVVDASVAISDKGIFVAQRGGAVNRFLTLKNYVGFDTKGQSASGPQDVLFASPAPQDGEWFVQKLTRHDRGDSIGDGYAYSLARWKPSGELETIRKSTLQYNDRAAFVNSQAIFADMPPLADSFRTGTVMLAYGRGDRGITTDSTDFHITPWAFSKPVPTRTQIDCFGLCNHEVELIGHHPMRATRVVQGKGAGFDGAVELAQRTVLAGTPEAPVMWQQIPDPGFGALSYGMVEIGSDRVSRLFEVHGKGMNVLRGFVGTNSSAMTLSHKNDVMPVMHPKGVTLLVPTRLDGPYAGFDNNEKRLIRASEVQDFVERYSLSKT
jgi:hypothetical protein